MYKEQIKTVVLDGEKVPVFFPQIGGKKAIVSADVLKQLVSLLIPSSFDNVLSGIRYHLELIEQGEYGKQDKDKLEQMLKLMEETIQFHRSVNCIKEFYELPEQELLASEQGYALAP